MKNFHFIANTMKTFSVVGIFVAGSLLSSCSKDASDEILPPEPEKKTVVTNDTVRLSISDLKTIDGVHAKTNDDKKTYILKVTQNLGVDAKNVNKLSYFGAWKKKKNVTIDWSRGATKSTGNGETYGVYATEAVPFPTYEQYVEEFGNVPLIENTEGKFVVPAREAEKYQNSGVTAAGGYNGENISINEPEELSIWVDIIQNYASGTTKSGNAAKAPVTFAQSLGSGVLGLVVKNAHMNNLYIVTKHADITNKNLQAGEANVIANAELLSQYKLYGDGSKFNSGKLFKVIGADGVNDLNGKTNGQYLRTDTASMGTDGTKLTHLVPDTLIINVHGVDATNLKKLSDWSYGQITIVPQTDNSLPGKQKALLNHTQETLAMISVPAGNNSGAVYKSLVNLVVTKYIKTGTKPTVSDFDGAIKLQQFNDSISDMSYQKLDASNNLVGGGNMTLLDSDVVRYDCRFHQIMDTKLKSRIEQILTQYNKTNRNDVGIIYLIDNGLNMVMSDKDFDAIDLQDKLRMVRGWGFAVSQMQFIRQSSADPIHIYR